MRTNAVQRVVLIALCALCMSAVSPIQKEQLKGMTSIHIIVEDLDPDLKRLGLSRERIERDVEVPLRRAGLKVVGDEEALKVNAATLLVQVTSGASRDVPHSAVSVDVSVNEIAYLERNKAFASAVVWTRASVNLLGHPVLVDTVRDKVKEYVEDFTSDYREANPPPQRK